MNEYQRRYFLTVSQVGNITRAAEALYISRQGLSSSINKLEDELGVPLFERSKDGVELTEGGNALFQCICEQDRLWDACRNDLQRLREGFRKTVTIGMQSLYFDYADKRFFLDYRKDHPSVDIEFVDGDFLDYWKGVKRGDIDFAYTIRPPESMDILSIKLVHDDLCILMSADNELSSRSIVDFETDLLGKTVIQTGRYESELFLPVYAAQGIESRRVEPDRPLIQALVATGDEYYIGQCHVMDRFVVDTIVKKPLVNAPIDIDPYVVFRTGLGPEASSLLKSVVEQDRYRLE